MRTATMEDFIKPEFQGKRPLDYEVLETGEVVRKDRWEVAVKTIAESMGEDEPFDIDDVVSRVTNLMGGWLYISEDPKPSVAFIWRNIDIMLVDGSIILGMTQHAKDEGYSDSRFVCERNGEVFDADKFGNVIVAYRPTLDDDTNLMPPEIAAPVVAVGRSRNR